MRALDEPVQQKVPGLIGACNHPGYGTRGTQPLQLWRSWEPSVFGPLQLFLTSSHFRVPQTSWLDLNGERKRSGKGIGETCVEQ